MSTYGPTYERELDEQRIRTQMNRIRDLMLARSIRNRWLTLTEIREDLESRWHCRFPEASISAQLRHLRKKQFGSYRLEKRHRQNGSRGTWEYVLRTALPEIQKTLWE